MIKSDAPFDYEPLSDWEYHVMTRNRVFLSPHRTRGRYMAMKALHKTSVYTFEHELISEAEFAAMTVGEHRFRREKKGYILRGRGLTRLKFSLRNAHRR